MDDIYLLVFILSSVIVGFSYIYKAFGRAIGLLADIDRKVGELVQEKRDSR